MCEYVSGKYCRITQEICPFVYYCAKEMRFRPLKSMPIDCVNKQNYEVPAGYSRVRFERKGKLYIDYGNTTIVCDNIFDKAPLYVKITQVGNDYVIEEGQNGT